MSLKEIMERLSYDLKDPEIRAVQARLYREAIEGKLTVQTLQEHKTYLDMDIKTLSCLPCMEDYSIECFEEEEYMDNSEEHLQKQVDMIQSGSCGHTTDAMMILGVRLIHLLSRNDLFIDAVDVLNQCECDLNSCTVCLHLSPIDIAVSENQAKMVKFLVENACNINQKPNSKHPAPIEVAIENGFEDIIDILLTRRDIEVKFGKDAVYQNNMLIDCIERCPRFVEQLLKLGASPDVFNENGLTPLMLSVANCDTSMTELLLRHGANPNFIPTIIPSNRLYSYGCTLIQAVMEDELEIIKLLLEAGADPNFCIIDYYQQSVLMTAVYSRGSNENVKLLLQFGSSVNHRDSHGYTAIHFAAWQGKDEIVAMLLEAGAEHDTQTKDLNTPLALAANGGYFEPVKRLLEKGCSVNNTDKDLDTPLHYAAFNGSTEGVQLLLEAGTNPELCNRVNASALWNAVYNGHIEVVKQLLLVNVKMEVCSTGRDPSPSDDDIYFYDVPRSPLYVAVDRARKDIAMLLIEAGYKVQKETWLLEKDLSEEAERLASVFADYCQNPCSLMLFCRNLIRSHIGCCRNISEKMEQLDIPLRMKDFLTLKHLVSDRAFHGNISKHK